MEFLDTNVLVYAASQQAADQAKAALARDLLRRGPSEFAISLQVLQEFSVAARAPRKLALTHEEALTFCSQWRAFTVLEPTLQLFKPRSNSAHDTKSVTTTPPFSPPPISWAAPRCTRRT